MKPKTLPYHRHYCEWDFALQFLYGYNSRVDNGGALSDSRWQKQRISFNKFVGVTLQTIFEPYD